MKTPPHCSPTAAYSCTRGFFSAGTWRNAVLPPPALNVCNDKRCWGVMEGLLVLAAGGFIVAGGDLFLCSGLLLMVGGSFVAGRDLLLIKGSIVAGCWGVYWGWLLGDFLLLLGTYCCWGGILSLGSIVAGWGVCFIAVLVIITKSLQISTT